jgi:Uma2 family endonuclease
MRSGRAFAETQFTLRADRARIPDVAWVAEQRLQQIPRGNQAIAIAPDVAIEIISESEQPSGTEQKLRDYLEAGVEVWQIFPSIESLTIWSRNQGTRLEGSQVVESEKLPGFSVAASSFFAI